MRSPTPPSCPLPERAGGAGVGCTDAAGSAIAGAGAATGDGGGVTGDGGAVTDGSGAFDDSTSCPVGAPVLMAPSVTAIRAMTVPTGTVSPSGARISANTPDAGAGISVSTLSVEISSSSGDDGPHGHGLAFGCQNLRQHSRCRRRNLRVHLVGGDLQQRLVLLHALPNALDPADDLPLLHRLPHLRHHNVHAHLKAVDMSTHARTQLTKLRPSLRRQLNASPGGFV